MALLRCKACGKLYSYEKEGFCPKCGAYNRPPRKEWVDRDGSIHYMDQRDADSGAVPSHRGEKVCFEQETETAHRKKSHAVNWQQMYRTAQKSFSGRRGKIDITDPGGLVLFIAAVVIILTVGGISRYSENSNFDIGGSTVVVEPDVQTPVLTDVEMGASFSLGKATCAVADCHSAWDDPTMLDVAVVAANLDADALYSLYDGRLVWQQENTGDVEGWLAAAEIIEYSASSYTLRYDVFTMPEQADTSLDINVWLVFTETDGSEIWVELELPEAVTQTYRYG